MNLEKVYQKLKSEIGDNEFEIAEIRIFINGQAKNFRYFESMFDKRISLILNEEKDIIATTQMGGLFNPWCFCDIIGRSKKDILHEERDAFKQIIDESVQRMSMQCDNIEPETWDRFINHLDFVLNRWDVL